MDNHQEMEQIPQEQPLDPIQAKPVAQTPAQPVSPAPQPAQPVYTQNVYAQPAYRQPVYPQPVYTQPVYQQPVYVPPQPAYQAPVVPMQPKQTAPKNSGNVWKRLISITVVIALIATGCLITGICTANYIERKHAGQNSALLQSVEERLEAAKDELSQGVPPSNGDSISGTPNTSPVGGLTVSQVYAQTVNSVVTVTCSVGSGYTAGTSQGSGFVLTADGYVATNYHVVEDANKITIKLVDGTEYAASYVGGDQTHDIALVKANASELKAVTIGRSDNLIVGDQVVAIGYPLSTQVPVLTVGYVSAKNQIVDNGDTSIRMLQTDAAINSGNSGGPLFNMKGEVVGITSAKYSGTTSSGASIEGVGFAIPIDDVIGKFNDLKDKGYISGAYLGITAQTISAQMAATYNLSGGVNVVTVTSGSCAQEAGLQREDIIVNLAGYDIATMSDLSMVLQRLNGGEKVTITVYRPSARGEVVLTVTLDEKPQQ